MFKSKGSILAFGMGNTYKEPVSDESIDLLMTKILLHSSGTFSLIKSILKRSLVNEKITLIFLNFNSEKRRLVCLLISE